LSAPVQRNAGAEKQKKVWLNHCIVEVNHMSFLKTCLAVLLGFLLGAALYRPQSAKAAGNVYVQQVAVGVYNPVRGTNVVGFSCAGSGNSAACYIASQ
jgi:ABC-type methionine transport system permease subunit